MVEPEDYGFSHLGTLSHVGTVTPSVQHSAFWRHWQERVAAEAPELVRVGSYGADPSDSAAEFLFESLGVRIGCRLVLPPEGTPVRAGLVTSHGYGGGNFLERADGAWASVVERGVAVLEIRVRGFPGSMRDTGAWFETEEGWIAQGLPIGEAGFGELMGWSYVGAVADLVNAMRVMRVWLDEQGEGLPLYLHGESFGGGLAVTATHVGARFVRPERLVIALPSMGDWVWRVDRPVSGGIGLEVSRLLVRAGRHYEETLANIRLADTVVHARRVRLPVLAKLALLDDVVPAPSAAAVYNALDTDPGAKWRFVTRYGHYDGGIADARRHALFARIVPDFLDPRTEPAHGLEPWLGVLAGGDRRPGGAG
ncbi:MAG: acetylxylan esterase [Phycisphaerales bacterium]|nr:acetylxylan esterase [Phycisphaerales bacterium]